MQTQIQGQTPRLICRNGETALEAFNFSDPRYLGVVRLMLQWAHGEKPAAPEMIEEPEEGNLAAIVRVKIRLRMKRQRHAKC